MANNEKKKELLTGRNIYKDKHGRTIYYDTFTKEGYYVNKEDEKKFFFYKNRFVIILFGFILTIGTFLTYLQAFIGGTVAFVLVECYYRMFFFPKLKTTNKFDKEQKVSPIQSIMKEKKDEPVKILLLFILYFAFSALVLANALMEKYSNGFMLASIILSIGGIYFSMIHLIAYLKIKKS